MQMIEWKESHSIFGKTPIVGKDYQTKFFADPASIKKEENIDLKNIVGLVFFIEPRVIQTFFEPKSIWIAIS